MSHVKNISHLPSLIYFLPGKNGKHYRTSKVTPEQAAQLKLFGAASMNFQQPNSTPAPSEEIPPAANLKQGPEEEEDEDDSLWSSESAGDDSDDDEDSDDDSDDDCSMDGQQEDISPINDIGLNMDDDNGAVAENIPVDGEVILPNNQQWVWDGIKHRNNQNFKNEDDLMVGLSSETLIR